MTLVVEQEQPQQPPLIFNKATPPQSHLEPDSQKPDSHSQAGTATTQSVPKQQEQQQYNQQQTLCAQPNGLQLPQQLLRSLHQPSPLLLISCRMSLVEEQEQHQQPPPIFTKATPPQSRPEPDSQKPDSHSQAGTATTQSVPKQQEQQQHNQQQTLYAQPNGPQ
jgi:hypothetical protein